MWLYPEVRTLGDFIEYHAGRSPDRRALVDGERTISFGEFDGVANRVANGLLERGVAAGQRVGFLGLNSADFYFALVGCAKTRAAFTIFNWRLSAAELSALVSDCAPALVFVERAFLPLWEEATARAESSPVVIVFAADDTLEAAFVSCSAQRPAEWISEEDTAVQIYTSGTTGVPKGVMLSHGGFNRMRLCEHLELAYDWQENDLFLNALPNFHLLSIGIAFQCLYNGVAVGIVRQFDPAAICAGIERDQPTLLTLTPTMIKLLLDHPAAAQTNFGSVRLTLYAGSPISLGLIRRAIAHMPGRFMQFYGATETGGALSLLRPDEHDLSDEARLQSCGRPLPLVEFRIVDGKGQEVPAGEAGELLVRTPAITSGYWNQPEATAAAIKNGWYRTGDVARCDERGLFYIVDRVKDMIVSGGENIYCAEIENVLSTHPAVGAVAVIGVPDERWGEAVMACVVCKDGGQLSEDEVISYARRSLAGYKVPKVAVFMDTLPMLPSGKVSKMTLREPYWRGHKRGVA